MVGMADHSWKTHIPVPLQRAPWWLKQHCAPLRAGTNAGEIYCLARLEAVLVKWGQSCTGET